MTTPPIQILELIDSFRQNYRDYKLPSYNETQTRREFIDPFFEALGWDMNNQKKAAPAYREVIHEDSIQVGAALKAPDYSFRVGTTRKFFIEAKKPSVNIYQDTSPAFQLRRYGWSAQLPISILTDFEEFAVYDCRVEPNKEDSASYARLDYIKYTDYAERWDEIAERFSREAVFSGSLDKYAEKLKIQKGSLTVNAAFLKSIETWREILAQDIARRNPQLSQRDLNFAVQITLDRMIFLRICEDRNIEPYGQLESLNSGSALYEQLIRRFRAADLRYNSGLFHFEKEKGRDDPDNLTLTLTIGDNSLKQIIQQMYYPNSPYVFNVIPVEILGQVYEQFLGKVITLNSSSRSVVIEEKPEVRKAGGVFYTPSYIVDYIVKNTVGQLLEGRNPEEVAKLKILDPSCGSGSFLLGAYQFLLDWHLRWYSDNNPSKQMRAKKIYQGSGEEWRLTTTERKRILLNNIYGVDIDNQAVETTKLSLLLKVLEGETGEGLAAQLQMFRERALPNLESNIKCGNSLIGPDFYSQQSQQMAMFDEETHYRINVFDWSGKDGFAEIMQAGGFDAVIGNPPYIRVQALNEWAPVEVNHYKKAYHSASKGNYDIYVVFVERGLSVLNKTGRLGFILPHKFFNAQYGQPLRQLLAEGQNLSNIVHFGDQQIFANATTYTCLLFLDKAANKDHFEMVKVDNLEEWRNTGKALKGKILTTNATSADWNFTIGKSAGLFEKLKAMPVKLGDVARFFVGLQTSADTVFLFKGVSLAREAITQVVSKELNKSVELESCLLKPVVRSGNIGRFWLNPTALVLFPYSLVGGKYQLIPEADMRSGFPRAWNYLTSNKSLLAEREHGKFAATGWYQLYPKNLDEWEQPKIMLPYMITRLSATYDEANNYFVNVTTGGFGMTLGADHQTMKYTIGVLNSNLLDWTLKNISTNFHGGYIAANKQFLVQLPFRPINFDNPLDKARHDQVVILVENMLDLHKRIATARTTQEKTMLQRQIDATDQQIDRLVYELYDLTDEEIKLVEGR